MQHNSPFCHATVRLYVLRAQDSFCCSKSHYAADKQRPLNDLLFREPNIIAAEISDIASVRPEESAPLDSRAQHVAQSPHLIFFSDFSQQVP